MVRPEPSTTWWVTAPTTCGSINSAVQALRRARRETCRGHRSAATHRPAQIDTGVHTDLRAAGRRLET